MANYIALHQNGDKILINLDNAILITPNTNDDFEEFKSAMMFINDKILYFDETYDQIKNTIPYLIP